MKRSAQSKQPKLNSFYKPEDAINKSALETTDSSTKKLKVDNKILEIVCWNINGSNALSKKTHFDFIKNSTADFMCFQELKSSEKKFPNAFNLENYHTYWNFGEKNGYSGTGLCCKEKPLSVTFGMNVEIHDKEGRLITAEMEDFYLITAYIPNSGQKLLRLDYRTNSWDVDLLQYISNLQVKKPVIYCGDLNVARTNIDLARPDKNHKTAGFTDEERQSFEIFLKETKMIDTFRHLYPDVKDKYSFWSYMSRARANNLGWRIDYFLISPNLVEKLVDSVILDEIMGSDHCPIKLSMKLPLIDN